MNKERRKEIAKAIKLMEEAKEILEIVREEEQDSLDNMPESLQYSERGELMQSYIDTLDEKIDCLETDELEEIIYL